MPFAITFSQLLSVFTVSLFAGLPVSVQNHGDICFNLHNSLHDKRTLERWGEGRGERGIGLRKGRWDPGRARLILISSLFPKGLDSSRQVNILRKTRNLLSL